MLTNETANKTFVTRDLTAGENALQAGWAKSKSGLLDRLEVNGSRITIRRRDGAVDELQKGAFRCTSYRTGSGRRLFVIKTDDGRKIRFMEMSGMLSAAEWDYIANEVLGAVPSDLNKVVTRAGLAILIGMFVAALTVGFSGGTARSLGRTGCVFVAAIAWPDGGVDRRTMVRVQARGLVTALVGCAALRKRNVGALHNI